jgi:type II secretory pathway component PulM
MEEKSKNLIILLLIIVVLLLWNDYSKLREENRNNLSKLNDFESSLDDANDNIDQLNSSIDDAKSYTWSNYEDMGSALDDLETIDR